MDDADSDADTYGILNNILTGRIRHGHILFGVWSCLLLSVWDRIKR